MVSRQTPTATGLARAPPAGLKVKGHGNEILQQRREHTLVQPLWKTGLIPPKAKADTPWDPAVTLWGMQCLQEKLGWTAFPSPGHSADDPQGHGNTVQVTFRKPPWLWGFLPNRASHCPPVDREWGPAADLCCLSIMGAQHSEPWRKEELSAI